MPIVKIVRKRGVNMVIEAHAETLFMPTGLATNWQRRVSNAITKHARAAAPVNKRPRWAHYGEPLKTSITTSTTKPDPLRLRAYSAVGSRAPYAAYVDQGTGIYGGGGPYEAKILPPWLHGSASLYEATWIPVDKDFVPLEGWSPVGRNPVLIQGQKGQHFFQKGIERGYREMRVKTYPVPYDPRPTHMLSTIPNQLAGFLGNTSDSPAFRAQLAQWRLWRDEAWIDGRGLGRGGGVGSKAHEKYVDWRTKKFLVESTAHLHPNHPDKVVWEKPKKKKKKKTTKPPARKPKPVSELAKTYGVRKKYTFAQAQHFTKIKMTELAKRYNGPIRFINTAINEDGTFTTTYQTSTGLVLEHTGHWEP